MCRIATPTIYQQYGVVAPPHRFVAIVEAYMQVLHLTSHSLSVESGASPSYLYSRKRWKALGKPMRVDPTIVADIVAVINRYLPTNSQQWPLEDAYAAAGVENPLRIYRKQRMTASAPGAFFQRCFTRWRVLPSLRQAAIQIAGEMNATPITHQTIIKWDQMIRDWTTPPELVAMNPITYFTLCAWMGETPDLRNSEERIVTLYEKWQTMYKNERGNHA